MVLTKVGSLSVADGTEVAEHNEMARNDIRISSYISKAPGGQTGLSPPILGAEGEWKWDKGEGCC